MFCSKCGIQNSDSASFCSSCGHPLSQQEAQLTQNAESVPNRMTAAIFATIFFWPLGIPAIVNASHANAEARAGHYAEAQRAVKRAKRWITTSFFAFGLIFIIALSIPIYDEYVKADRSSEAKTTINAIWQSAQVYYQDKGEWPTTVEDLENEKYLEIAQAIKLQWTFQIVGYPPQQISGISTKQMKGGAGKTVTYDLRQGSWTGYGLPN